MNILAEKYADRNIGSIFLYTHEAHPGEYYPHLTSMEQKFSHARALRDDLGVQLGVGIDLCRALVDEFVTVTEDEIKAALRSYIDAHHMLIEGAAAVALASCMKGADWCAGGNSVVVVCGANINRETLKEIL